MPDPLHSATLARVKIIYLHQYFLTPEMAGATRSYEMARRLVRAGHEVHMITSDQRARPSASKWRVSTEGGIKVHWANVRYGNEMGFGRRLLSFVRFAVAASSRSLRLEGDVIFATSTPLTIALPALFTSMVKRIPFVFEVRDLWPDVPIAIGAIRNPIAIWAARKLESLTYRRAAAIVALAPGMRDDIIAKGIPPEKLYVIPNGCDLDVFGNAPTDGLPRNKFPWLGQRKMVLFAGTIGMVNGVDYLVRLAAHVATTKPEVRFVVIGEGRERDVVHALAEQEGVLGISFFMLPAVPKRELVGWLKSADMIVALFTGPRIVWKDGVQNKLFDALAAGKPIANNFDGWQSRVAEDAKVGITLDPVNIGKAAGQLLAALADEAWLSAVPARARLLAEGPFNRDRLAEQLEQVLRGVAAARS